MHNRTTSRASVIAGGICVALFALLTVALLAVDRQPIAGDGSLVGLATFNLNARALLGQHDLAEKLSNILLIVPAICALAFAIVDRVESSQKAGTAGQSTATCGCC